MPGLKSNPLWGILFVILLSFKPGWAQLGEGKPENTDGDVSDSGLDLPESTEPESPGQTLIPFPFIFYTPETKTGFGGAVSYFFRDTEDTVRNRPSNLSPVIIYTQKRQIITSLNADLYWSGGRYHFLGDLAFLHFPDTFWGIGNEAADEAEEDYTPRIFNLAVLFEREFFPGFYLGGTALFAYRRLHEVEKGGLLDNAAVPGTDNGSVVGVGLQVTRDSRDSTVFPRQGSYHSLGIRLYEAIWGSDYAFTEISLDLRRYLSLSPSKVLALRALAVSSDRTMPFDRLPALGGDTLLRGYYAGRYRDRNLLACQAELRAHLWRRLGWVGFFGLGQVAYLPKEFRSESFWASGGVGIRFLVSRAEGLNLRADFGFGKDSSGFYLGMGEVF
jgi:hypothetical protein